MSALSIRFAFAPPALATGLACGYNMVLLVLSAVFIVPETAQETKYHSIRIRMGCEKKIRAE